MAKPSRCDRGHPLLTAYFLSSVSHYTVLFLSNFFFFKNWSFASKPVKERLRKSYNLYFLLTQHSKIFVYRLTEFPRRWKFFLHWRLKEDLKPNIELILGKWSSRFSAEGRFPLIRRRCRPRGKRAPPASEALASSHRHWGGGKLSLPSEEGFSPSTIVISHPE